jgi:hypothetical protein
VPRGGPSRLRHFADSDHGEQLTDTWEFCNWRNVREMGAVERELMVRTFVEEV